MELTEQQKETVRQWVREGAGLSDIQNEILFSGIHDDPRWLPFMESIGKSPEQLGAVEFGVSIADQEGAQ